MFNKSSGIDHLLTVLSSSRRVNDDGSQSLTSFSSTEPWEEAIAHCLKLENRSFDFKRALVSKISGTRQILDREYFQSEAIEVIGELDRQKRSYLVAIPYLGSACSLKSPSFLRKGTISLSPSRSTRRWKAIQNARQMRLKDRDFSNLNELVSTFPPHETAFVRIDAISPADAYQLAMSQLQVFLGILSYVQLYGWKGRFVSNSLNPLTRYQILSPISVHDLDGNLATQTIWLPDIQRWLFDYIPSLASDEFESKLQEQYNAVIKRLLRQNKERLELALQTLEQYYLVVSCEGDEQRFIELWKLLEMVAISRGERAERIADRLSSFWLEKDAVKSAVLALLSLRNSITHRRSENASVTDGSFAALFRFSKPMLNEVILGGTQVSSLQDLHEYLDLNVSSTELIRQIELREAALERRKKFEKMSASGQRAEPNYTILKTSPE